VNGASGWSPDDIDPEPFIERAQEAWERTAAAARAGVDGARSQLERARAVIRLARVLRGPGFAADADRELQNAIRTCRPAAAASSDPELLEVFGDLLLEAGRRDDALAAYGLAALAGSDEAADQLSELSLEAALVTVGAPAGNDEAGAALRARVRELPPHERRALALTGLGTKPEYEVVGAYLRMSPDDVRHHERRGLALLAPALLAPEDEPSSIDELNIGATVRTGGFDPEFEDSTTLPGDVIGGTLTNDERAMIRLMDPADRARYLLQKRIQEKAEMKVLLSRLQSLRHQSAMSVINNIR
jgi:tetratricopeptide (TPR) repeat protein